jgi:hypothetical protein
MDRLLLHTSEEHGSNGLSLVGEIAAVAPTLIEPAFVAPTFVEGAVQMFAAPTTVVGTLA